jgi:hypothetical protein
MRDRLITNQKAGSSNLSGLTPFPQKNLGIAFSLS